MRRTPEPCLCGAPDCARCFPWSYMNALDDEDEDSSEREYYEDAWHEEREERAREAIRGWRDDEENRRD